MRNQIYSFALLALLSALVLVGCGTRGARPPTPSTTAQPSAMATVAGQVPSPAGAAPTGEGAILFLRGGALTALDLATSAERTLAAGVSNFAAAPDGRRLALVRGHGETTELWLLDRDGTNLRRLTTNERAEAGPHWSPDGLSLAYTSSALPAPHPPDWLSWSAWCVASEVRVLAVAGGPEQTVDAGCQPVFSPDGGRLAFTTPPTTRAAGSDVMSAANSIAVVDRDGTKRATVAASDGAGRDGGYLVYGPAWSPDGEQVVYQRFLGYQLLVDVNLTEEASAHDGRGVTLGTGAGWLLPPSYSSSGSRVLVIAYNFSDARGLGGYEEWGAEVLRLGETAEILLPSTSMTAQAVSEDWLPRVTAAAWAPDESALAVVLPPGWNAAAGPLEPIFTASTPGDLWLSHVKGQPERRLAENVDFASPLLWLPAP